MNAEAPSGQESRFQVGGCGHRGGRRLRPPRSPPRYDGSCFRFGGVRREPGAVLLTRRSHRVYLQVGGRRNSDCSRSFLRAEAGGYLIRRSAGLRVLGVDDFALTCAATDDFDRWFHREQLRGAASGHRRGQPHRDVDAVRHHTTRTGNRDRLPHRSTQILRVMDINQLDAIAPTVIEAARETLVIGT